MAQGIPPAAAMASYRRSRLPFDRLQTLKTLKMPRRPFACIALCCSGVHASGASRQLPRGSFHQALWPQAFVVRTLKPAVCFHRVCCYRVHSFRLPAFKPLKCFAAGVLPLPSVPTASAASFYFISFFSLPFCWERANVSSGIVFPTA